MFDDLVVSWKLSKALRGCERLQRHPEGTAKIAFDELVALGPTALAALEKWNQKFIEKYVNQVDKLRSGSPATAFESFVGKSDFQQLHRQVLELQQARVIDLIEAIEKKARIR